MVYKKNFSDDIIVEETLHAIETGLPSLGYFMQEMHIQEKLYFFLEQVGRILNGEELALDETSPSYASAKELGRQGATSGFEMEELVKMLYLLRQTFWKYLEDHSDFFPSLPLKDLLQTVRKVNEYLSQVNLAIGREYLRKEREVVMAQRAVIEKKQAQLDTELKLARKIQQSIFPSICEYRAFKSCAKMIPSGAVGGDFYDVLPFGDPATRVDICIGDVQGKGIPAALLMMMTISIIWDCAHPQRSPQQILSEVNWRLRSHVSEELTQFVSLFYLSYFIETREVRFAKAGHEDALLIRKTNDELITLAASGYFLGLFDDAVYEEKSITVCPGDRLYLFTDGVHTLGNNNRVEFSYEDFVALLYRYNRNPIDEALDLITKELERIGGGQSLKDDVAILVVEF